MLLALRASSRALRCRALLQIVLALAIALGAIPGQPAAPVAAQVNPCSAPANPVVAENCLTGNPSSEWDLGSNDSSMIMGYATDISVDQGQTVRFKIDTDKTVASYRIDVYRMGYYAGMGARRVASFQPKVAPPQMQPACLAEPSVGLIDCGNWTESATWQVPANAVSGIYFAKLVRTDGTAGVNHVPFIVRDDDGGSDVLFQTSDTTWQAYNSYGGASLYVNDVFQTGVNRAYKVSYNRPFVTREGQSKSYLFNAEYPMVRWLERNGYDVSYSTGVDSDRRGAELLEHEAFLSVGHDEYWSGAQRANVEAARNAGVHLGFFSGNEVFWKTRWESAIDGSGTPYRTLVSYKETMANAKIDPSGEWTGTWRDPRFSPPADGGRPENQLTGTMFSVQSHQAPITVPAADGKMRFWRNTDVATLGAGQSATLGGAGGQVLGFEWDEVPENGFRPSGLIRMSTTTASVTEKLVDYGSTVAPGTATHSLTLYKHASGALVFGAGTIQWSWGLDAEHDRGPQTIDTRMQQATINLFADMGVQPATLQSGLVAAAASSDAIPPTSTITAPVANATVQAGQIVTVTGTAADVGGVVGGVEVSTDGGTTWRAATGRTSWSYTWSPTQAGAVTLLSRAVDDSGNIESPQAGVPITVQASVCPCTLWNTTAVPSVASVNTSGSVELGVKFRADAAGWVTGVRFYKGPANTGTHVGKLWTTAGTLLASATFTGESATGWQQVNFASPVQIQANTTYIASYVAPNGGYAADSQGFATEGVASPPLYALAEGVDGSNGLYSQGASGFPNQSYRSTNYWVDVVFTTTDTFKPVISSRSPTANATGGSILPTVTATFNEPVQASTIVFQLRDPANNLVAATTSYDEATRTARLTPNAQLAEGTAYRPTVSGAKDLAGNVLTSSTWTFTTATCPCSVWNGASTPASGFVNALPLELGTKFQSDVSGFVSGVRYYRSADDPGTHTTSLWASDGTLMARASTPEKDASGCPCSIFGTAEPTSAPEPPEAIEVGVKFRSSVAGYVTGIRFYKHAVNTGTHVGKLWTRTGTKLAEATFTNESATGWQQVTFSSPVQIQADTVYVASYFAPNGGYAQDVDYFFSGPTISGPLEALEDGIQGGNGVYRTGSAGFPNSSWGASNYWVDVLFSSNWYASEFAQPVAVAANTTYVVSQHSSAGHYVVTPDFFAASGASFGPVRLPADGADGPNGIFREGASGFPIYSGGARAYLVDPVFHVVQPADVKAPRVVARSPAAGATGTAVRPTISVTFNEPVDQASIVFELRDQGGTLVPSAVGYDGATYTATLTPSAALATGITYALSVSGARDPAGNAMPSPETWSFSTQACPCNLWGATAPSSFYVNGQPLELGVKFRSDLAGYITGLRFYKAAGDTGTHVANLWRSDGTLVASALFTDETASGWQPVAFGVPVQIQADTTYVASYHSGAAHYAVTSGGLAQAAQSGPLRALANGAEGPNGVFREGASGFPTNSSGGGNYFVDVFFSTTLPPDTVAPRVIVRSPAPGAADAALRADVTAKFNEPIQSASLSVVLRDGAGTVVPSSVTYDGATTTATLRPTDPLAPGTTYTVAVSATDDAGNAMAAPDSWSFAVPSCPCSLWSGTATPSIASIGDGTPIELGLKFQAELSGYVTGIRFYKGPGNTGSHVGKLWSSTGTLLASATFSGESATGWQSVEFGAPVQVSAGTTYVASYFAPNGGYSYDGAYFVSDRASGALRALGSAGAGGNGVYRYGSSGFPSSSFNSANYWVDVVFTTVRPPDTSPPTLVARAPASGATSVGLTANVTATFSEPVTASSVLFELLDGANNAVAASVGYDAATQTATLTPASPLTPGTTYTARVSGATDEASNTMAPVSWSFSTPTCPCSLWDGTVVPANPSASDSTPIEVGVKLRSSVAGYITGVRFYRGANNTGQHTGNLWAADGTLLATATLPDDGVVGWHEVAFAAPVAISADTTYVASAFHAGGGYSYDSGYFAVARQSGPLQALSDTAAGGNGVYRYGSPGFPTSSYGAANYWVDVAFTTTP